MRYEPFNDNSNRPATSTEIAIAIAIPGVVALIYAALLYWVFFLR